MMFKNKIQKIIKKSIVSLQKRGDFSIPEENIQVEKPREKIYGDYSTNIAFFIAKEIKQDPMSIAQRIKREIQKNSRDLFEKIEIKPPGFINFFINTKHLSKSLKEILKKKENFGKIKIGRGIKTNIEFVSANPVGPLHVGNGRGAFFGDVLARVLEFAGFLVEREYYINDAKTNTQIRLLGKTAKGKDRAYLTPYLKRKIKKYQKKLAKIQDDGEAGHFLAREIQKDIKKFLQEVLKIKFNNWISEEDLYQRSEIKKCFQWLQKRGLVYQYKKAFWVKTSKFGAKKDWVIIRASGQPTYLLGDIAYHQNKIQRGFKKIIDIWGADHQAHLSKMKAVMKMLNYKGDFDVLISQIVVLKGKGKLSKRKGQIISLAELIEEVGLDVARFFYLQKDLNTHMEFDLDLAKEQSEKNPVYYIQYAYVRCCSILRRKKVSEKNLPLSLLKEEKEIDLIKKLIIFPEIIERVAKNYQVHCLTSYAFEVASCFHQFYQKCPVLMAQKGLSEARLALVLATKIVLENLLKILGISLPKRM